MELFLQSGSLVLLLTAIRKNESLLVETENYRGLKSPGKLMRQDVHINEMRFDEMELQMPLSS